MIKKSLIDVLENKKFFLFIFHFNCNQLMEYILSFAVKLQKVKENIL